MGSRHWGVAVVTLLWLIATSCGGGCEEDSVGELVAEPVEEVPRAAERPGSDPTRVAPTNGPALEGPRWGEVFYLEGDGGEIIETVLALAIDAPLEPGGAELGVCPQHNGGWMVRHVADVDMPYPRATFIGREPCEATITAARRVRADFRSADSEIDRDAMFIALSYTGCEGGTYGIVGAPVTRHVIRAAELPVASQEFARAISRRDADMAGDGWDEGFAPPRALVLPDRDLAIVIGHGRWVLRGGVVQADQGRPVAVVEAGPLVLIELISVSEGWVVSLNDFAPSAEGGP